MNVSNIKGRFDRGKSLEYLFFWSHRPNPDGAVGKTCFSQWFEASPDDLIWGIGLAANNPNIKNSHLWQGTNLLGFALMEVRSLL